METQTIPSLIESHDSELGNVAYDLVDGLKIYEDDRGFIIGNLALEEGVSPHKAVNSSPRDLDYRLLSQAALLVATEDAQEPVTLTVGFPYSTYKRNRELAEDYLKGVHEIHFDPGHAYQGHRQVSVERVEVVPEIVGCIIAARSSDWLHQSEAFFMCSLGYGTFEACLSTESGVIQRTTVSTQGLRHAIDIAQDELEKEHYLDLRNEHQFAQNFKEGRMIIDRRPFDITDIRQTALRRYYEDVVSPALRRTWKDADFGRADKLVLAGGGAHLEGLVGCFQEEFDGILEIESAKNPTSAASRGYCLRSKVRTSGREIGVGIDLGNANTVVSYQLIESGTSDSSVQKVSSNENAGGMEVSEN